MACHTRAARRAEPGAPARSRRLPRPSHLHTSSAIEASSHPGRGIQHVQASLAWPDSFQVSQGTGRKQGRAAMRVHSLILERPFTEVKGLTIIQDPCAVLSTPESRLRLKHRRALILSTFTVRPQRRGHSCSTLQLSLEPQPETSGHRRPYVFLEIYKASVQRCLHTALLLNGSAQNQQVVASQRMVLPEPSHAQVQPVQVVGLRGQPCLTPIRREFRRVACHSLARTVPTAMGTSA